MFGIHVTVLILFFINGYNSHESSNDKKLGKYIQNYKSTIGPEDLQNHREYIQSDRVILSEDIKAGSENIHKVSEADDVIGSMEISKNTRESNSHDEREGFVKHIALPRGRPEGVYEQPASGMGEVLESDHKERGGAPTYQLENKNDAKINPRLNKTDWYVDFMNSQSFSSIEDSNDTSVNEQDNGYNDGSSFNFSAQAYPKHKAILNSSSVMKENYYNEPHTLSQVSPLMFNNEPKESDINGEINTFNDYSEHIDNTVIGHAITQRIMSDLTSDDTGEPESPLVSVLSVLNIVGENSNDSEITSSQNKTSPSINISRALDFNLSHEINNQPMSLLHDIVIGRTSDITFEDTMKNDLIKNPASYSGIHTDYNFKSKLYEDSANKNTEVGYKTLTQGSEQIQNNSLVLSDYTLPITFTTDTTITNNGGTEQREIEKSAKTNQIKSTQTTTDSIQYIPNAERLIFYNGDEDTKEKERDERFYTTPLNNLLLPSQEYKKEYGNTNVTINNHYQNLINEKNLPGVLYEDCSDCDLRQLPIRPAEQRGVPKKEVEHLPSSKIRFAELPEGRKLKIHSLGLSDGIFLFNYLSEFLSWIQPNEFPVELLREALKTRNSWFTIITESVQVEVGFVVCLVAGVLLALAVPLAVLSHTCYRMGGRGNDQDDEPGWGGNCKRRTLVFVLQILLILLFGGTVAMLVTNEQLSGAVLQSSDVLHTALGDVSSFIHNAHLQLHFLVTQSVDQALQAVHADLDNVDSLLGRPIQQELVGETGLDVALDSLGDLTRAAKTTTEQVERFLDEARVTQEMVVSSRDKLSDLRQQVELFRRACGPRDRNLCDAIDATGLEITLRVDRIKTDERLNMMRRLGSVALEAAAREAKEHYLSVPTRVEADTKDAREAVRRQLTRQRAEIDESSRALEQFARTLTSRVSDVNYELGSWMQHVDELEYWRWITCMGAGVAVLMVWSLLLSSMCCGCCGSEKAAGPTILVTVVLVCLFSTVLWSMVLVGLLVGGHGEVFVCRPLYDEPEYHVITDLVDQPGVFYTSGRGGFISNVLYGNDTLDVPIKQVLHDCQDNRGVYPSLGLHRVFDVEGAVQQSRWGGVSQLMRAVRANLTGLQLLSPPLQDGLADLLNTLAVNFTEHRIQMSKSVTGKDLDSFARQLDNIGNQMRDLATASRLETLSSRTRRLIDSHIRPLEAKKDSLVYQLTALEVQTVPLQRQVNQSLSHLKTIQFFVNSQGDTIALRKSREYGERLAGYVDQLRDHVMDAVMTSVAPCRPLWDIFNSTRLFLCRHTMDPLNGFWFATMWCLLVLLVATPVCLKLVDYYRASSARSAGSPTENLMIAEQGAGWSSPGYDIKCSKN